MMRNTIAERDCKPRVYLWYAVENKVVPVFLPIEDDVFDEGYIEAQSAEARHIKDERFDALITRVQQDVEIELSYSKNMEAYLHKFRTEKSVVDKIWTVVK
jgi:hypothetical protein